MEDFPKETDAYSLLFRIVWEPEKILASEPERLSGPTEAEWNRIAEYVAKCGLARPLLGALRRRELSRMLPASLVDWLHSRATQDVVDDLLKREALRRIATVLREIGGGGILLKGTALQVLGDPRRDLPLQRATGDIDIYLEPPMGAELRKRLLENDFRGRPDEPRTAAHHLAPVLFRGVVIEIHERIMPAFWGLPEREMIAHALPIAGLGPMSTLSPEGLMLHAGIHAASHLFAQGMKSAWDLLWIQRRFPELDWDQLARWVGACRVPRAFWVPVRVLSRELMLPVPAEFLCCCPTDRRQLKSETIARDRIFSALEGPFDLNPFTKTWVFMLLHDSWMERIAYLKAISKGTAAEARRSDRRNHPSSGRQRWRQVREAFAQWRRYQRLFTRANLRPLR